MNNSSNNKKLQNQKPTLEQCKEVLSQQPMLPMMSIKDVIIDSVNVIPWFILLIIIGIIIII
jgi:hypothetical protein